MRGQTHQRGSEENVHSDARVFDQMYKIETI